MCFQLVKICCTLNTHISKLWSEFVVLLADNSVLDCIYSEVDRTYYILDLMCWASYPIYDSEVVFVIQKI